MAPHNRYIEDAEKMASARSRLDQLLSQEDVAMEPVTIGSIISQLPKYRRRGLQLCSIAEIVERVNSSSDHPIDLTQENVDKSEDPLVLLKRIPMKYLHFPEDVRPPYYGTYTRLHTAREERRLARNPFSRTLPQANYDYDSEAEWEEPEEGEDIDSDGEEDLDEDGDDDLEGFLDDEDDAQVKRRLISSDLQPVSTGICWEDPHGVSRLNDGSGAISTEFKEFRMGCLLGMSLLMPYNQVLTATEPYPRSIDPFSTAYWAPEPKSSVAASSSAMQPPRMPLTQRPMNSMLNTLNAATSTPVPNTGPKPAKPPKRMIPNDQLPDFKAEVEGSDLTKIALIEALKKKYVYYKIIYDKILTRSDRFPKLPKDAISNTLSAVAARVGPKEVEKRWVLL
jgi:chromatin assembly factor 1 subunit A